MALFILRIYRRLNAFRRRKIFRKTPRARNHSKPPLLTFFYSFLPRWEIPVCPFYRNQQMVLQYTKLVGFFFFFFPGKGKPGLDLLGVASGYSQPLRGAASRLPPAAARCNCKRTAAAPLPPEGGRMSPSILTDLFIRRSIWWGRVFGAEGEVSEGGKAARRPRRFGLTVRVLAGSPQGGRPYLTRSPHFGRPWVCARGWEWRCFWDLREVQF